MSCSHSDRSASVGTFIHDEMQFEYILLLLSCENQLQNILLLKRVSFQLCDNVHFMCFNWFIYIKKFDNFGTIFSTHEGELLVLINMFIQNLSDIDSEDKNRTQKRKTVSSVAF